MFKVKLVVLLGAVLTLAACGDSNNTAATPADDPQDTGLTYLAYVQKMIDTSVGEDEPWDVDTVHVEQPDTDEALDVM